jgi:hypothetical protein
VIAHVDIYLNRIKDIITVWAAKPKQIVAIYNEFFSISALKNKVIKADQTNTIRSTGGNLSLCAINTAINVGILDRCNRIIVSQPKV